MYIDLTFFLVVAIVIPNIIKEVYQSVKGYAFGIVLNCYGCWILETWDNISLEYPNSVLVLYCSTELYFGELKRTMKTMAQQFSLWNLSADFNMICKRSCSEKHAAFVEGGVGREGGLYRGYIGAIITLILFNSSQFITWISIVKIFERWD